MKYLIQYFVFIITISATSIFISCNEDEEPMNTLPVIEDQSFSIAETTAGGTVIGTVQASDDDGDVLNYAILSGNTNSVFELDAATGELTVSSSAQFDFGTTPAYTLTVQVGDGQDSANGTITINITEVNHSPVIETQTFEVIENSASETVIGTVLASDPDDDELTYSMVSGNSDEFFLLDESTGELTVNASAALDYETTSSYALIIAVSDGDLSAEAEITINLLDQQVEPYQSADEVLGALVDGYELFKSFVEYENLFEAVYSNTISSPSASWNAIHDHTQVSTDAKVFNLWHDAYDMIYVANNIIASSADYFTGIEQSEIEAQAIVLRAYAYYKLVFWFNNVPLETELPESSPAFTAKGDLLDFIIADLDQAIAVLPSQSSGGGNDFTKWFAQALISRVYLVKGDYSQVISKTADIISNSGYTLSLSTDVFTVNTSEIFWGFDITGEATFDNSFPKGDYVSAFRFTEAYLLSAEALNEINGPEAALERINTLRGRDQDVSIVSASSNEIRTLIRELYQNEMNFEGLSYEASIRFGLAEDELGISAFRLVLPIPQAVVDANPNAFQNPGY